MPKSRLPLVLAACLLFPALAIAQGPAAYRLLKLDGQTVKWGGTEFGEGASLTYAFITAETQFDDARNCRRMAPVDGFLENNGIEKTVFERETAKAFAAWQAAAGVTFTPAADPATADIRIGVDLDKNGWAHADVMKTSVEGDVAPIERGLVCLNSDKAWKIGFGQDDSAQDLRYTLTHEIGHAIGLNHASPSGQIMSFTYGEDFSGLQTGDIEGARILYGAPALANTTVATLPAGPGK